MITEPTPADHHPTQTRRANILNVVKAVFTYTVEAGGLRSSPAAGVSAPRSERHEMRFASEDDVANLANAIVEPYATLIYTAAYTGLRAGEIAALRVRDLDSIRGRIHVRQAVAEVRGELIYGPPKSGKDRSVSLPRFLREMLVSHTADYALDGDALVFRSPTGTPLRHSSWYRRHFRPAADSVGLEGFRFHDLRHTCVGFLISAGAHPRAIMERLGHSSITVTMDTYGHLLPSLDDALTGALEERFQTSESDGLRPTRGLHRDRPSRPITQKPRRSAPLQGSSGVGLRGFEPPPFGPPDRFTRISPALKSRDQSVRPAIALPGIVEEKLAR